jgi:hypothetical protein
MKVIGIVGSRRRRSTKDYLAVLDAFCSVYDQGDEIVSGGCLTGADHFAEQIARTMEVPIKIYHAPWKKRGRTAGLWRNTFIALDSRILIACVAPDRTGGTEDTIHKFESEHPGSQSRLILV